MSNDDLQDATPENDVTPESGATPENDATPESGVSGDDQFDSATFDSAEFDSGEFDSGEFDSGELDVDGVPSSDITDSGQIDESESRESEEVPVASESESRESEEVPVVDESESRESAELPLVDQDKEEETEEEDEEAETAGTENEWLLATFFSACGLYVALGLVFFLDRDVLMNPTKNMDWAFATILIPISFICFMSASLGLLSKPRGKQWLFLLPTLGPLVPIALAVLSIIALMNM